MREPSRFLLEMPEEALVPVAGSARRPAARGWPAAREPSPPSGDSEDAPLRVGARVRHARWGEGLVIGVQRDGEDWVVTVNFAAVGKKRLALQYAHLEEL
jgi:DNA helicase-2/ATP-dependent DNA helicase PcrA